MTLGAISCSFLLCMALVSDQFPFTPKVHKMFQHLLRDVTVENHMTGNYATKFLWGRRVGIEWQEAPRPHEGPKDLIGYTLVNVFDTEWTFRWYNVTNSEKRKNGFLCLHNMALGYLGQIIGP